MANNINDSKKYISLARLSAFLDNIKAKYSQIGHKHTTADLTDYTPITVDDTLSSTSSNPVQNKVVDAEFEAISQAMGALDLAIDGKADASHDHNDVYYTQNQVDTKLQSKSDTTHNHDSAYDTKGAAADSLASAKSYTDTKTANLASTTVVDNKITSHNTATTAHNDIRDLIGGLTTRLNTLANSDDTTLDQMSEVVTYIKNNKSLIDGITTSKVNVSDIVNNLTTNVTNKPLSAAQGVEIKKLIDALQEELDSHSHTVSDITDLTATADELNYMDGVTSNVQTQLDGKSDSTHTHSNASLGQGFGDCYTTGSTTEKAVDIYGYNLVAGGVVSVKFIYSVPASATMNINSKGAKSIYYKGSAITEGIIKGNDTATFIYDGSRYHLISVDRWHKDIVDLQANDCMVSQRVASANSNYPLLLAKNFQTEDYTGQVYFDSGVYLNPYYNRIYADISGTATGLSSTLDIAHGGTGATDVSAARTNLGLDEGILLKSVEASLPENKSWFRVCYGGGKFVAIATSGNTVAYSEDGATWNSATLPISDSWRGIAYGNGIFVVVPYDTTNAIYSSDGINWTTSSLPEAVRWFDVAFGNGKFVAISFGDEVIAYSTDGINWTSLTHGATFIKSIVYGKGKFVAVSSVDSTGIYSTDGINWTEMEAPYALIDVAYGNGKFVGVSEDGYGAAYSDDGITWESTTSLPSASWESITYGNGVFVAVAYDSSIAAYSTDGINWTQTTLPEKKYWYSVGYGNGRFIAISNSDFMAVSTDGINWSTSVQTLKDVNDTDITQTVKSALGISGASEAKDIKPVQIITWEADD